MVASGLKRVDAYFFVTDSGREPVREWLLALDRIDRRDVGRDLMTLEFGWPVGMPLSRPMGRVFTSFVLRSAQGASVESYIDRLERLILLHAFIKRSRTTPKRDLDIARERMKHHQRSH